MNHSETLDDKALAELAKAFQDDPFGSYVLTQYSLQYNALHQQAESPSLSAEQKAMLIERAAGVKWAIDLITTKVKLMDEGYTK